jgi:hypothetical protein
VAIQHDLITDVRDGGGILPRRAFLPSRDDVDEEKHQQDAYNYPKT